MGTYTQITNFRRVKSVHNNSLLRSYHTQCYRFHCGNTPSLGTEFQNGMNSNCCMPAKSCGKRTKLRSCPCPLQ